MPEEDETIGRGKGKGKAKGKRPTKTKIRKNNLGKEILRRREAELERVAGESSEDESGGKSYKNKRSGMWLSL